jgi:hypothetical protein
MSEIATIRCEGCGKTTLEEDTAGWIRITATEDYSVDLVGKNNEFTILASDRVDFCCPECVANWFRSKIPQKKKSIPDPQSGKGASEEPAPSHVKKIRKLATEGRMKDNLLNRWSTEEKALIEYHIDDEAPDKAWTDYQKKFPGKRNKNAIYQRWYITRGKKKPAKGPVAAPSGQSSDNVVTRYAGDGKGTATNNALTDPLIIVPGIRVRQTKADGGRQIFGIGIVLARHGEIVEVRNGSGKIHKIQASCLEVISVGEKNTVSVVGES